MASVTMYNNSGEKTTKNATLPNSVFGQTTSSHQLINTAYNSYLAAGRQVGAFTKTRGEVRGGGKKPWKQKGTGRARAGSTRGPIWRGGGITFGPRGVENYTKTISTTSKRTALRQALSLAVTAKKVSVIESIEAKDGKTATMVGLLSKLGLTRRILIVVDNKSPDLVRACSNLQEVILIQATYLNVFHIMNADAILFTEASLKEVESWLAPVKKGAQ